MNNLAKYRGKYGVKQEELAEKLGISKAGVSFIETKHLSAKNALKCAAILGENPFALLGTDSFVMLPKTKEDKAILIQIIKEL